MFRTILRGLAPLIGLITISTPAAPANALAQVDWTAPHVSGELIVGFQSSGSATQAQRLSARNSVHAQIGAQVLRRFSLIDADVVQVPAGQSEQSLAAAYAAKGQVAYVEPNYLWYASNIPNDSAFGNLWGMNNTGQSGGTADADIDAPEAWDLATGSAQVIVGIIDSGVDYTHPDLAANIWTNPGETPNNGRDDDNNGYVDDIHGYDFANGDSDPMDDNEHGTHCAGTIGGVGNNGTGVAGVNWTVRIMALKFLTADGSGSTDDAVSGIEYAVANHARLTSNSWGGAGASQALNNAITAANNAGQLFIAAAGNGGADGVSDNNDTTPNYPSNYTQANVIAVAATDRNDQMASFSNYGRTTVDLGAPGVSIYSTFPGGSYGNLSGTSMATPHVAGAAALLFSANPNATAAQVKDWLLRGVDPVTALNGRCVSNGRLNMRRSLELAGTNPGPRTLISITIEGTFIIPENSEQDFNCRANYSDGSSALVEPAWSENQDFSSVSPTGLLTVGDMTAPSQSLTLSASYTEGGETKNADSNVVVTDGTPPTGDNDDFANAAVIAGSSGTVNGSNVNATRELDEPYHNDQFSEKSVWWTWTAPEAGLVVFDTRGSDFDTILALYRGPSLGNLLVGPSNDDINYAAGEYQSEVSFTATAGRTYYVAVDGYTDWSGTDSGQIVLNWNQANASSPSSSDVLDALLGQRTTTGSMDANGDGDVDAADLVWLQNQGR